MTKDAGRIYLSSPHMSGKEQQYVDDAFQSNWIAPLGPHVDAFEKEIANYVQSAGAVAMCSGTAAIHLSLRLLGVGKGDTVFCSTLTFVASANPILYQGAEPVFIDSEPMSWNMSPVALKHAFVHADNTGKLPKAVIVVNLYGQNADMDPLLALCNEYNVPVIEDAAESLGATYRNKASGTFGKFGIYSFNGNKMITTSGGGMLVSNDLEALEKARFWATQARDSARHYEHSEVGYNYRLSNVLAAIGRAQLQVLEDRITARRTVFERYYSELGDIDGIRFLSEASYGRCTRWLTALIIDPTKLGVSVDQVIDELALYNIEARPVWKPMHLQPLFKHYLYFVHGDSSISDSLFNNGICLPSGSNLTQEDQKFVIACFKRAIVQKKP
ncbi:aminotransferase class I/II-fold pyridoxal phosphate-dependent enzyme [Paenibacillus sp. LHD-38]|uniref:DegT/DnrJ/EryC1/StrS family aminotransferase n=1 Tax=Paenibacillus sp. LHD-38 TaxID=3072143 RepID=UPI00280D5525|nr:aminotransferase class I/II-fold pyridoxal phosphate-dependent enzyme [Paenibacillus sp. LHD-38]MDQ8735757.1 DegT/DnrJ/EryC1/StrS family aminotransferase [Paenibacillus sp. LHD-38]